MQSQNGPVFHEVGQPAPGPAVSRRSLLQIAGLGVASAVVADSVVQGADPVARCAAPQFVQPTDVQHQNKWEWALPQPMVTPGHVDPGPAVAPENRTNWDGKFGMNQIQPKGWIKVEDIRTGKVERLYDATLQNEVYRFAGDQPFNKPIQPGVEFQPGVGPNGRGRLVEPTGGVAGIRERLSHKIAPEFWQIEGGFDPEHFWALHNAIPYYEVVLGEFEAEIVPGYRTPVWGYNRQVPGPTFVEEVNRPLVVRFINELHAETSVHLHGGHTPSHSDGHPAFLICPHGGYRDYFYSNGIPKIPSVDPLKSPADWDWSESASTMWYHDHGNDITAHNALMGLAGFFLVTDAWERFLVKHNVLPRPDYVEPKNSHDIPIVLGDRCICKPQADSNLARIHFDPFDHNGYLGSIPICNGRAFARLDLKAHKYRFRFLNGALARVHLLQLWDAGDTTKMDARAIDAMFSSPESTKNVVPCHWDRIGKDSWMLDKPVPDQSILLGMANRADVIVDFKALLGNRKRATFFLVNVCDQRNGRGPGHGDNGLAEKDGEGNLIDPPRGNRENVPELNDPARIEKFADVEGGPSWGTLKLLRIEVVDDGSPDPCIFDQHLDSLDQLLKRPEIQQEVAATKDLSEAAGVHLREHEELISKLKWEDVRNLPTRRFDFERGRGAWRISHRFFDEERTDAPMVLGGLELWHLVNRSGGWWHPIHIHLESHQQVVVEFDKKTLRSALDQEKQPFSRDHKKRILPHDRCKHDTALLGPNTEIWLLMRFRTFLGPFVFHCHNLNHEDMRMMTNFDPRLESLGPDPIKDDEPLRGIVSLAAPMIPDELMRHQMQREHHPVPAPVDVQQFFGDEC